MARDLSSPVKCHAGFSGCDHPRAFLSKGIWLDVARIDREWRQPGNKVWQVSTAQGNEFILSLDEGEQNWTVTEIIH